MYPRAPEASSTSNNNNMTPDNPGASDENEASKQVEVGNVHPGVMKTKATEDTDADRERNKEYVQNLEKRNAVIELQNKALIEQIKKLKQLYEQDKKNYVQSLEKRNAVLELHNKTLIEEMKKLTQLYDPQKT